MWQPQSFYNQYMLRVPVMLSGEKSVRGLYNYPCSRIAVIHGKTFDDYELFKSTFAKREIKFFLRSWNSEPDISSLKGTIHDLEEYRPDTIIAVGGGSVIDGCKLCRLFYEIPYYEPGITRLEGNMLKTKFIAVPTTTGSGAEISSAAVYLDDDKSSKKMIVMHEFIPDVIVYDKRYVIHTPFKLLCSSSLDAAAHILEGYVSNISNSLVDVIAEKGLSLLACELRKVFTYDIAEININYERLQEAELSEGLPSLAGEHAKTLASDIIAEKISPLLSDEVSKIFVPEAVEKNIDYERLQYAGMLGGIVQNHCIVGAAHALAHQLTKYNYSHGEAVSLILPAVIKINSSDKFTHEKYDRIARLTGFSDTNELIKFISDLCKHSGLAQRQSELRDLLCSLADDEKFLENVKNDRGGKGNPIEITDDYIRELIRSI